jgi:acyl-CoA synthetase (AMP-forming)/AMP-acid ligase II
MSGYLDQNDSVDPAVDEGGWLHTGDLCSMDDKGVVTFRGRVREVVIRGGENVYPAEVEHVLSAHPSVAEAAVFGVPDSRLGERVVAAVSPHADAKIESDDLSAFVAERLSRYKRPVEWIIATTMPRTSTGKIRKHLLREWYEAGTISANCQGSNPL